MLTRRVYLVWCASVAVICLLTLMTVTKFDRCSNDENPRHLTAAVLLHPNVTSTTYSPTTSPMPSSSPSSTAAVTHHNPIDKSWRRVNRFSVEYQSQLASRLSALSSRMAAADDPEVIQLANDVIDPVPSTAAAGIKRSREIVKTPQASEVETITVGQVNGSSADCIAYYMTLADTAAARLEQAYYCGCKPF